MKDTDKEKYTSEDLRYRKAYIRDRLKAVREERLSLEAERDVVLAALEAKKADKSSKRP